MTERGDPTVVWAVVVAGGSGARFGSAKQHALLGGRPVLDWCLDAARDAVDAVVVVVRPGEEASVSTGAPGIAAVVAGGDTRSASVRAGLAAVPAAADVVLVHDAARPLASAALFTAVVEAVVAGADAAVPAVPVTDTIRRRGGGIVDRSTLVAVQTPQGFRAAALRRAHEDGPEATDDATLVEAAGGRVVLVEGETANLKITHPEDLWVAEALLARGRTPT